MEERVDVAVRRTHVISPVSRPWRPKGVQEDDECAVTQLPVEVIARANVSESAKLAVDDDRLAVAGEAMVDPHVQEHLPARCDVVQHHARPVLFRLTVPHLTHDLGILPVRRRPKVTPVRGVVEAEYPERRSPRRKAAIQRPSGPEHVDVLPVTPGDEIPQEDGSGQPLVPFRQAHERIE